MDQMKMARKQLATIKDYKATFATKQGQRVLYDMMVNGHIMDSTMSKGASPTDVCVAEGERNAVLRVLATLKMDEMKLFEFMNEQEKLNEQG